jgi:hypothetical protein
MHSRSGSSFGEANNARIAASRGGGGNNGVTHTSNRQAAHTLLNVEDSVGFALDSLASAHARVPVQLDETRYAGGAAALRIAGVTLRQDVDNFYEIAFQQPPLDFGLKHRVRFAAANSFAGVTTASAAVRGGALATALQDALPTSFGGGDGDGGGGDGGGGVVKPAAAAAAAAARDFQSALVYFRHPLRCVGDEHPSRRALRAATTRARDARSGADTAWLQAARGDATLWYVVIAVHIDRFHSLLRFETH